MHPLIGLSAGVAMVLFALRFLRKGADRLLEERCGGYARRFIGSVAGGFAVGLGAACLMPSSSGIATLTSRLAREPQSTPNGMLALLLGANVGITVLVLAGATGIAESWPVMLLAGVVLFQFTHREVSRGVGQLLLSLALVFLGLQIITTNATAMRGEDARLLLGIAAHHPIALAVVTCILTLAMQSSTATLLLIIGVAIGAGAGVANEAVLPAVAGTNAGIAVNALIIGWSQPSSRHPALANALIKWSLACLLVAAVPLLPSPGGDAAWAAAIIHLLFNLTTAAIGLCCHEALLLTAKGWAGGQMENRLAPRYLELVAGSDPRLALAASAREILRVADAVRNMLGQLQLAWRHGDRAMAKAAIAADDLIDALDAAVRDHLASCDGADDGEVRAECLCQLRYVIALESAGDVIEQQLAVTVAKAIARKDGLGEIGAKAINDAFSAGERALLLAEAVFATRDLHLAQRLRAEAGAADRMVDELRDADSLRRRAGMPHDANAVLGDLALGVQRIVAAVTVVTNGMQDQLATSGSTRRISIA